MLSGSGPPYDVRSLSNIIDTRDALCLSDLGLKPKHKFRTFNVQVSDTQCVTVLSTKKRREPNPE